MLQKYEQLALGTEPINSGIDGGAVDSTVGVQGNSINSKAVVKCKMQTQSRKGSIIEDELVNNGGGDEDDDENIFKNIVSSKGKFASYLHARNMSMKFIFKS